MGSVEGNPQLEQDLMDFWNPGGLSLGDFGISAPQNRTTKTRVFPSKKPNESAQNKEVKSKFEISVDGNQKCGEPASRGWLVVHPIIYKVLAPSQVVRRISSMNHISRFF